MRILQTTGELPTGKWLAKQREQHSLTIQQIARAVQWHPLSVRTLETKNRVVPPGWKQALKELGIKLSMPVWPRILPAYYGGTLQNDMETRAGMRHSRFWLSKHLGVSEEEISAVVQRNLLVPHDWLLKLAELGANVPELVRLTLFQPPVDAARPAVVHAGVDTSKRDPALPADKQTARPLWAVAEPDAKPEASTRKDTPSVEGRDERLSAPAACDERRKQSLFVSWSDEAGLHISLSTPLLDELPTLLRELLPSLGFSGLPEAPPTRSPQKAAGPGRG